MTLSKQAILSAVNPLYVINQKLVDYFMLQLPLSPEATDYVKKRGFTQDIMNLFQIGYCPIGQAMYDFACSQGWEVKLLQDIGFWLDKGDYLIVKFEDRLMFPFVSLDGIVHGFSGRVIHDNPVDNKYINTNNCAVYNKSLVVYGFNEAIRCNEKIESWILVEGNADVVSMFQAGFTTTVAGGGTAITEQHLLRLSQYTKNFIMMLDNDMAGLQGMARLPKMCQDLHLNLRRAKIEEVKDADEAIRTGRIDLINQALA
jgi:DNA primase